LAELSTLEACIIYWIQNLCKNKGIHPSS
jgi:hypothetical protein